MTSMEMDDGQVSRVVEPTIVETGASKNSVKCAESDLSLEEDAASESLEENKACLAELAKS